MSEPPTMRDALAAYRSDAALGSRAKARVRSRIESSIVQGRDAEIAAAIDPESARLDARAVAVRIAIPIAIAAAVLLALRAVAPELASLRDGDREADQAVFGASERTETTEDDAAIVDRDEPPSLATPGTSSPSTAADPPDAIEHDATDPDPFDASDAITRRLSDRGDTPERAPARKVARERPRRSVRAADKREDVLSDTTLAAEMALMRRARAALRAGDPSTALAELESHRRTFGDGQMAEDRDVLRIDALCDAGRSDDARAAAAAFVSQHPRSPHVARVQKICAAR